MLWAFWPARGAVRGRAGVVRTNRNPRRLLVLSCLLESVTGASQAMLVHHDNGGKDAPSSSQEPEHQVDPQSLVQLHCGGPLATCQPRVGGFLNRDCYCRREATSLHF